MKYDETVSEVGQESFISQMFTNQLFSEQCENLGGNDISALVPLKWMNIF